MFRLAISYMAFARLLMKTCNFDATSKQLQTKDRSSIFKGKYAPLWLCARRLGNPNEMVTEWVFWLFGDDIQDEMLPSIVAEIYQFSNLYKSDKNNNFQVS